MTYREKLIESLTKAGFHKGYEEGLYFKKLVEEGISIRVIFDDNINSRAEVYMSYNGKGYGNMFFETNCLYESEIEERAKKFGEICRKAVL